MKLRINNDTVTIEGYVNVVERDSDIITENAEAFIERIAQRAFAKSLRRRADVKVLLNHDKTRELASTAEGTATLKEDNVGLWCRTTVKDPDIVEKAKNGKLRGWSFGFVPIRCDDTEEDGLKHRTVKELDLREVSIVDNTKTPAYPANYITTRTLETGEELQIRMMDDETEVENVNPDGVTDTSEKDETGNSVDRNYSFKNRLMRAKIRK